jgi:hypothetical protein
VLGQENSTLKLGELPVKGKNQAKGMHKNSSMQEGIRM